MKPRQAIEYNWETFFLKNHAQSVVQTLVLDSFLKTQNWEYLWINRVKFHAFCFFCMPVWGLSKYIDKKLQTTCFYVILNFLKKQKETCNYYPCFISCIFFEEKYFSSYILLIDQVSWSGCFYFVIYCAICVSQLFFNQAVASWILKLTLSF